MANAVRIKQADGTWQDIALMGPPGPAGAPGAASTVPGPKGDPGGTVGASSACLFFGGGGGLSNPASTWTLNPIPSALEITSTDGAPDFTRNADGSLTVNITGIYAVTAGLQASAAHGDGVGVSGALKKKAGSTPSASDTSMSDWNVVTGGVSNNYPAVLLSDIRECKAGDRIAVYLWHSAASAQVYNFKSFSIARVGGPRGADGAPGPAGAAGAAGATASSPFVQCNFGTSAVMPVGTSLLPIGTIVNISDPADFTRNANGTMTVNKTGTYIVSAGANCSTQLPAGSRVQFQLEVNGAAMVYQSAHDPWAQASLSWTGRLAAGDVVRVTCYSDRATDNIGVTAFGISAVTGPKGDTGSAKLKRGIHGGILTTTSTTYAEMNSLLRAVVTPAAGTFINLRLSGQWEHSAAGGYMAVQFRDLASGNVLPYTYFVARARAANENATYCFDATISFGELGLAGERTITPFWSTGSGTCSARGDTSATLFTATELASW